MGPSPDAALLHGSPNALARHYRHFRVEDRLLLTGHSHQAWPDVGLEAQTRAWLDAAEYVDDKWDRAFERADLVRAGFRRLLDDDSGSFALGANTHELVVRFLSALPLRDRPRLVTTDGEFHSIRRQVDRLAEEGVEVVKLPSDPVDSLAERLGEATDDVTAAVLVSSVLFGNARRVPGLRSTAAACERVGAELLVDAYHHLNAVPLSLAAEGLTAACVVGGGYKYCQLGEGNCFLRVPEGCEARPVVTGWFSEFGALSASRAGGVRYGTGPDRFAGSTYDPTSHYRGAAVFEFFLAQGLDPSFLREVSLHQVGVLARAVDELDLPPSVLDRDRSAPLEAFGGFLALRVPGADRITTALRRRGVYVDHRGDLLRLGPAPYLSDLQLRDAVAHLGEVLVEELP